MNVLTKEAPKVVNADPKQTKGVKYTVNLDWFECLASGGLVEYDSPLDEYKYDGGRIVLMKKKMATKLFKHSYEIFLRGKIFGHINICPRNPEILKENTIQFQAVNNVLYEVGFTREVKYLFDTLKWEMKNLSRIDIAIDGIGFLNINERRKQKKIECFGKARWNTYETAKGVITGYDVGSKASNKWLTCYNKLAELEKSNKQYIKTMWERAGLDTKNVERIELKLRNESIKMIKNFNWEDLDNFEYLASIFRTQTENFFSFMYSDWMLYETNFTRAKQSGIFTYDWMDWDSIGGASLERLSTKMTNEVYRVKLSAKTMYGIYCATGTQYYADIAQEMAMNVNCLQWYIDKLDEWKQYFAKKGGNNKDGLITYEYFSNYVQYAENEQLKLFAFKEPEYVYTQIKK